MRIARFKAFAEYRNFVITDRFDFMVELPDITEECCRRGYLVQKPNIVYHYIWNELWRFALTIDYSDSAPKTFGDAERVIHLPIVTTGPLMLHGTTAWEEESFHNLPIAGGRYSLFSAGWNFGQEALSDDARNADDESYWGLPDVERYHWTICPMVNDAAYVVSGAEFMY